MRFADFCENAFLDGFPGLGSGNRAGGGGESVGGGADESGVTLQDGNGTIASSAAGHGSGRLALRFESIEDFVSTAEAADVSGADAGGFQTAGDSGKVVVEGDGAEKIGQRECRDLWIPSAGRHRIDNHLDCERHARAEGEGLARFASG